MSDQEGLVWKEEPVAFSFKELRLPDSYELRFQSPSQEAELVLSREEAITIRNAIEKVLTDGRPWPPQYTFQCPLCGDPFAKLKEMEADMTSGTLHTCRKCGGALTFEVHGHADIDMSKPADIDMTKE